MKKIYLLFFIVLGLSFFLRFFNLSSNPPSPYWEEVALGYDAFSILKTAKDHHGNFMPLVAFESFGDWKPSLYFYSIIPFILIFDLSVLAVRLPSAVSGLLLIIFIGFLVKLIFSSSKFSKIKINSITANYSLILGILIAGISPWAIQFSRAGWEVNLATLFITISSFLILRLVQLVDSGQLSQFRKLLYWFAIIIFLIFASYTYHATRIIAPLIGMGGFVLWLWSEFNQNRLTFIKTNAKLLIFIPVFSLTLFSPILLNMQNKAVSQRFEETSIFSDLSVIQSSNVLKEGLDNNLIARIIYHRYILFSQKIVSNFFTHFNFDFLFVSGDQNPRHNTGFTGQLYHIEIIFLIFGLVGMMKNKNKYSLFIFYWLIIAILPASITNLTPHALRILPAMPAFLIIICLGIYYFFDYIFHIDFISKNKNIFIYLLFLIYIFELLYFWNSYTKLYPKLYANEWQYGYQQMVAEVNDLGEKNPQLPAFISRIMGRPAMYYWFFSKTDPILVQNQNTSSAQDQGEFLEFDNVKFINSPSEIIDKPAIIAITQDDADYLSETDLDNFTQIKNLKNEIVWYVGLWN